MAASWKRVVIQGDNAATVALATTDTVATLLDSFVFADASDSNLIKRDAIADVIGLVAGTNTATGLKDTAGVLSVDMSLTQESPATTDLVLAWDAANSHFYTATVANIGAAGENTTYNVSTSTASAGIINIDLTDSDSGTDSVSITGDSGVVVSQATDQITIDIPDATDATDGIFRAQLSHTSLASASAAVAGKVLGKMGIGGVVGDLFVRDEDNFASADATSLATTESIKAYVDAQVTAADLDITDGTNNSAVDLDAETLTFTGTTNEVDVTVSAQEVTFGLPASIAANVTGDVTGNADTATELAISATTDTTTFLLLSENATNGNESVHYDADLKYNANTNTLIVPNLQVNGTSETIDVQVLNVEDQFITLASGSTTAAAANTAGLRVASDASQANFASFRWYDSASDTVAGWKVRDTGSSIQHGVAVLDKGVADPSSTPVTGAMYYNSAGTSGTKGLWIYID